MGRLSGKTAIVVGAGQTPGVTIGNGRATALRFAQEGAQILLVDRDFESAQETLELIEKEGATGAVFKADIAIENQCEALINACVDRFGRVDILHNNVGIGVGDRGASHMTAEVWDRIFNVNIRGVMFVCKYVLPVMREQGAGVITNISSVAAICATGLTAYKTSKAALNAYTQTLATGNAKYGIRANVIMPGLMNTPMAIEVYVTQGMDREKLIAERDARVPLKAKMGSAWDIANAALFLASDEAAFITGVCLPVDGGQSVMIG